VTYGNSLMLMGSSTAVDLWSSLNLAIRITGCVVSFGFLKHLQSSISQYVLVSAADAE